jgi:arginyl-tRNA synthetase
VQYAHARCQGVLKKAGVSEADLKPTPHAALTGAPEWALATAISRFPAAVAEAAWQCEPHIAARAVLDVAKALSQFYQDCPVVRAEPGVRENRLALVAAAGITVRKGLWVLGPEAPPMRAD